METEITNDVPNTTDTPMTNVELKVEPTAGKTTKKNNLKPFTIPADNEEQTTFFKKVNYGEPNSMEYRNLIYRIGLGIEKLEKLHIPTISLLYSIGVCPKCIYRFLNIKDIPLYQESYEISLHTIMYLMLKLKKETKEAAIKEEAVESTTETPVTTSTTTTTTTTPISSAQKQYLQITSIYDPNLSNFKKFVCSCCLGILQDTSNKELFLDAFIEKMGSSGHEFKNYSLALVLPNSIIVRQQSIAYYLEDEFPAIYGVKDFDWELVDVKEGVKWQLGPIIGRCLSIVFMPSSDFRANLEYIHQESEGESQFLLDLEVERKKNKRQRIGTKRSKLPDNNSLGHILDLLECTSKQDFKLHGNVPPLTPVSKYTYNLTFSHQAIYLAGKYNKYVRDLSQTPWQYSDSSIQDLVCKDIKDLFKADAIIFTTSGREDTDVRMLNQGRPFYIEITNPHRIHFTNSDFEAMEHSINSSTAKIEVRNLQLVTKKQTGIIKDSGGTKQKNYRCVIWTNKVLLPSDLDTLNNMGEIDLKQITPIRVLHRRSLMTRDKKISKLIATFISPHFFMLDIINAQAGTYIKEFVHGDLGRTTPNIGQILGDCEADILQLDVLNVDLDFPAKRPISTTNNNNKTTTTTTTTAK